MASPAVTPRKPESRKHGVKQSEKATRILGSWIPASAGMPVVGLDIHAIALIFEARSCPGSFDGGTRKDTEVCPCTLTTGPFSQGRTFQACQRQTLQHFKGGVLPAKGTHGADGRSGLAVDGKQAES